jgi:uracil-DNA glycosylase
MSQGTALEGLVREIKACRICVERPKGKPLPHEPRPVLVASKSARILIAGQAPGTRVHASGIPFTDPSGDRLRAWLGATPEQFYNPGLFAIAPMGFCFPGLDTQGSDMPPRKECAPAWRTQLLALMPQIELILAIGGHAQAWHLRSPQTSSVNRSVLGWRSYLDMTPKVFALPHPSWRNSGWLNRNPWFEAQLLPVLREEVRARIN